MVHWHLPCQDNQSAAFAILNCIALVVDEDNLVSIDYSLVLHTADRDKNIFCGAAIQYQYAAIKQRGRQVDLLSGNFFGAEKCFSSNIH